MKGIATMTTYHGFSFMGQNATALPRRNSHEALVIIGKTRVLLLERQTEEHDVCFSTPRAFMRIWQFGMLFCFYLHNHSLLGFRTSATRLLNQL